MLILARKPNESIKIDGVITVTVTKVQGKKVYLGIDAPANVIVHRAEIQELVDREERKEGPTHCTCHERDSSYACPYCYAQGYRGHMQKGREDSNG